MGGGRVSLVLETCHEIISTGRFTTQFVNIATQQRLRVQFRLTSCVLQVQSRIIRLPKKRGKWMV